VNSIAPGCQETSLPAKEPAAAETGAGPRSPIRSWLVAAAVVAGAVILFTLLLRISMRGVLNSDGATNALQAMNILHGNLLLHSWTLDDATYYGFELPLFVLTEAVLGLHTLDMHVVGSLTYLIVIAFAMLVARRNSSGLAAVARCGIVLTILAVPLIMPLGVALLDELPNHIGTSVFLLGPFWLADRAPSRWFTAPLIALILAIGQLSDATVRYIAVPAIVLVCGYRMLAERRLAGGDAAIGVAAIGSVPIELAIRAVIIHFGGFAMIQPRTTISPVTLWPLHAERAIALAAGLFGFSGFGRHTTIGLLACWCGLICVIAACAGVGRVVWTWRTAGRAEQMLVTVIAVFFAVFIVSTYTVQRELLPVLPCGAALAARACVPAGITISARAWIVAGAAGLAAILPLSLAAVRPPLKPTVVPLTAWLDAHGLKYGIGPFWIASTISVQSGDKVRVPPVSAPWQLFPFAAPTRATKASWYNPSSYDATFLIAGYAPARAGLAIAKRYFGRPASRQDVAGYEVLIYRKNLLKEVAVESHFEREFGVNPHVHKKQARARALRRLGIRPDRLRSRPGSRPGRMRPGLRPERSSRHRPGHNSGHRAGRDARHRTRHGSSHRSRHRTRHGSSHRSRHRAGHRSGRGSS
jgi:hypothetical protein